MWCLFDNKIEDVFSNDFGWGEIGVECDIIGVLWVGVGEIVGEIVGDRVGESNGVIDLLIFVLFIEFFGVSELEIFWLLLFEFLGLLLELNIW